MGQKILDTNIIIRFLTNDTAKLADQAEEIIKKADDYQLFIPDLVIAEIIWVLLSFYRLDKEVVINKLESILACSKFDLNRPVLKPTLEFYREHNISFIDAYLLTLSQTKHYQLISFDQDLKKLDQFYSSTLSSKQRKS